MTDTFNISKNSISKIDKEILKYPASRKSSAVMAALTIIQTEKKWLDTDAIKFVAGYLEMPEISVWEVATFYNMYNTKKVGEFKLTFCTNLPCMLAGASLIVEKVKEKLKIDFNDSTPDGKFTLKEGECMGACCDATLCLINDKKMVTNLTLENINDFIENLANGK